MSFAKRHKKGSIDWGIDTKDFEYFSLADLFEMNGADEVYTLFGVFINKNKTEKQLKEFGPSPVGILADRLVNLPSHMADEVADMMNNEEDIADLKKGVNFKIRSYESHGKTCYSPDWIDEEEDQAKKK